MRRNPPARYNASAMQISELGEFNLIDRIAAVISRPNARRIQALDARGFRILRAIGDDAAAWNAPAGARVITTDAMVEGVHFNLNYTDWRSLGWKCLAANISDVAAMGCVPTYAVVTLGLRPDLPVEGLEALYEGMMEVAARGGGAIVGGDVVKSPAFFITVALQGAAPAPDAPILLRSAANPGDLIAVTGPLGASAAGLRLLMSRASPQPDADPDTAAAYLTRAHNRPVPRVNEGVSLAAAGVRCAMDISDGLMDDLEKLCRASEVSALLHADRIPVDRRLKSAFPDDWLNLAVAGGEDYELLFTAPPELMDKASSALPEPPAVIGRVGERPVDADVPLVRLIDAQANPIDVTSGGWDHFRSS